MARAFAPLAHFIHSAGTQHISRARPWVRHWGDRYAGDSYSPRLHGDEIPARKMKLTLIYSQEMRRTPREGTSGSPDTVQTLLVWPRSGSASYSQPPAEKGLRDLLGTCH